MKPSYAIRQGMYLACLDYVDYYGQGQIITRIFVPPPLRRQGLGNQLLAAICHDADDEQIFLYLEVSSYRDGGPDNLTLCHWYRRHGFRDYMSGVDAP